MAQATLAPESGSSNSGTQLSQWKRPQRGKLIGGLVAAFLLLASIFHGRDTLFLDPSDTNSFHLWLNSVNDWITFHRTSNPFFQFFVEGIRKSINWLVNPVSYTHLTLPTNREV